MTVRDLIAKLSELHPSTPILQPAPDHSYRTVEVGVVTALYDRPSRTWSEDFGEEMTPESEFGKRFKVVVIR